VFLDPAKLLVILIVALVVLGPDKLPTVASQLGAAWGELRRFRERLETEVRGTFPDLPSSQQVVQAVRSPLAFLDQLADAHDREQNGAEDGQQDGTQQSGAIQPSMPMTPNIPDAAETQSVLDATATKPSETVPGDAQPSGETPSGETPSESSTVPAVAGGPPRPVNRPVGRTRPWRGSQSAEAGVIPDDPSMN
jgi:TatA/E family protein of Tat protein translocase